MDCDFFESSYYYPQLSPQGETMSGDDLSQLVYPIAINPNPIIDHDSTKQVGNPIAVATEYIIHSLPQTTPVLSEASEEQSEQEVIPEPLIDIANDVPSVELPRKYELTPKEYEGYSTKEI